MEARGEYLQMPKVQLKQNFWITEDSMAKLRIAGAESVDVVTEKNRYYDTASDDLAMAGLWLSQRDQEWFLIVEAQEEGAQEKLEEQIKEKAADPIPDLGETLGQKMANNVQQDDGLVYRKPSKQNLEQVDALLKNRPLNSKAAGSESERPTCSSPFTELVGKSEITTYLAAHLRLDLTTEERENATMEDFLRKAGIEHYASNHIVNQTTYRLSDRYTVIVRREAGSLRASATVVLEADVLSVCQGLEEIKKLAAYLRLEEQGIQSEREFMT